MKSPASSTSTALSSFTYTTLSACAYLTLLASPYVYDVPKAQAVIYIDAPQQEEYVQIAYGYSQGSYYSQSAYVNETTDNVGSMPSWGDVQNFSNSYRQGTYYGQGGYSGSGSGVTSDSSNSSSGGNSSGGSDDGSNSSDSGGSSGNTNPLGGTPTQNAGDFVVTPNTDNGFWSTAANAVSKVVSGGINSVVKAARTFYHALPGIPPETPPTSYAELPTGYETDSNGAIVPTNPMASEAPEEKPPTNQNTTTLTPEQIAAYKQFDTLRQEAAAVPQVFTTEEKLKLELAKSEFGVNIQNSAAESTILLLTQGKTVSESRVILAGVAATGGDINNAVVKIAFGQSCGSKDCQAAEKIRSSIGLNAEGSQVALTQQMREINDKQLEATKVTVGNTISDTFDTLAEQKQNDALAAALEKVAQEEAAQKIRDQKDADVTTTIQDEVAAAEKLAKDNAAQQQIDAYTEYAAGRNSAREALRATAEVAQNKILQTCKDTCTAEVVSKGTAAGVNEFDVVIKEPAKVTTMEPGTPLTQKETEALAIASNLGLDTKDSNKQALALMLLGEGDLATFETNLNEIINNASGNDALNRVANDLLTGESTVGVKGFLSFAAGEGAVTKEIRSKINETREQNGESNLNADQIGQLIVTESEKIKLAQAEKTVTFYDYKNTTDVAYSSLSKAEQEQRLGVSLETLKVAQDAAAAEKYLDFTQRSEQQQVAASTDTGGFWGALTSCFGLCKTEAPAVDTAAQETLTNLERTKYNSFVVGGEDTPLTNTTQFVIKEGDGPIINGNVVVLNRADTINIALIENATKAATLGLLNDSLGINKSSLSRAGLTLAGEINTTNEARYEVGDDVLERFQKEGVKGLTLAEVQSFGVILESMTARAVATGKTLDEVNKKGTYSALNDKYIGTTQKNYNANPDVWNEIAAAYFDGSMSNEFGLKATVPCASCAFYNTENMGTFRTASYNPNETANFIQAGGHIAYGVAGEFQPGANSKNAAFTEELVSSYNPLLSSTLVANDGSLLSDSSKESDIIIRTAQSFTTLDTVGKKMITRMDDATTANTDSQILAYAGTTQNNDTGLVRYLNNIFGSFLPNSGKDASVAANISKAESALNAAAIELTKAKEAAQYAAIDSQTMFAYSDAIKRYTSAQAFLEQAKTAAAAQDAQGVLKAVEGVTRKTDESILIAGLTKTLDRGSESGIGVKLIPDGAVSPVHGGKLLGNSNGFETRIRYASTGGTYKSFHYGDDLYPANFRNPEDRTVVAATGGVVVSINPNSDGYGQYISIQLPDGKFTRYAHINPDANIKIGDTVEKGQTIAQISGVGTKFGDAVTSKMNTLNVDADTAYMMVIQENTDASGNWTGGTSMTAPHLHFELTNAPDGKGSAITENPDTLIEINKREVYERGQPTTVQNGGKGHTT